MQALLGRNSQMQPDSNHPILMGPNNQMLLHAQKKLLRMQYLTSWTFLASRTQVVRKEDGLAADAHTTRMLLLLQTRKIRLQGPRSLTLAHLAHIGPACTIADAGIVDLSQMRNIIPSCSPGTWALLANRSNVLKATLIAILLSIKMLQRMGICQEELSVDEMPALLKAKREDLADWKRSALALGAVVAIRNREGVLFTTTAIPSLGRS